MAKNDKFEWEFNQQEGKKKHQSQTTVSFYRIVILLGSSFLVPRRPLENGHFFAQADGPYIQFNSFNLSKTATSKTKVTASKARPLTVS